MAINFINSVHVNGNAQSSSVDLSACNGAGGLFVAIIAAAAGVLAPSADTGSNSWTGLTERAGTSGGAVRMFYKLAPVASATHTFTNGSNTLTDMAVLGFSGVDSFDQESGQAFQFTPEQPGSLTPTTDGTSLFVTGMGGGLSTSGTVSGPFILDTFSALIGGTSYSRGSAYFIQTSSGAQNPSWTTDNADGVVMAVLKPSGGGGMVPLTVGIAEPTIGSSLF